MFVAFTCLLTFAGYQGGGSGGTGAFADGATFADGSIFSDQEIAEEDVIAFLDGGDFTDGAVFTDQEAPVAVNDTYGDIAVDTGDRYASVLGNDTYIGTPTITIVSQSGPSTAVVSGSGALSQILIPTDGVGTGTQIVTYELTATGNIGSDQATLTVNIVAA